MNSTGTVQWKYCNSGKFGNTVGASSEKSCLKCPKGSFTASRGRSSCSLCRAGTAYRFIGATRRTTQVVQRVAPIKRFVQGVFIKMKLGDLYARHALVELLEESQVPNLFQHAFSVLLDHL